MSPESNRAFLIDFQNSRTKETKGLLQSSTLLNSLILSFSGSTTSHHLHCCNWSLSYHLLGNQSSLILSFVSQFSVCPSAIPSVLSTKYILNQPTSFYPCCIYPGPPSHHHLYPDCIISLVCFHCPSTPIHFPSSTPGILLKCKSYHSPA